MERKIRAGKATVNDGSALVRSPEIKFWQESPSTDTSSSAMALRAEQGSRAGCPGAPKPAAAEARLAPGAERPLWGCRRVTPAAGMKPGITPALAAHGVDSREGAGRSQAGFDGNLLHCPVLKSFGRCVRTGLFFSNVSVPANKCVFNGRNVSAQKL